MIKPVPRNINRTNLIDICNILNENNIKYMIFYGTALGFYRENDVIEGDDDIDIIVDVNDNDIFTKSLIKTDFNKSLKYDNIFHQYKRTINGFDTYVDFYLYEKKESFVIDKWNFSGKHKETTNHLHIPNDILFEPKSIEFNGTIIKVPKNLEGLCMFLYGPKFMEPLKKNVEYKTEIINNVPKITYLK